MAAQEVEEGTSSQGPGKGSEEATKGKGADEKDVDCA